MKTILLSLLCMVALTLSGCIPPSHDGHHRPHHDGHRYDHPKPDLIRHDVKPPHKPAAIERHKPAPSLRETEKRAREQQLLEQKIREQRRQEDRFDKRQNLPGRGSVTKPGSKGPKLDKELLDRKEKNIPGSRPAPR